MSMEFGNDNEIRGGGGGSLMGLMAGSMMNRDDGRTTLLAAIVFVIVFIIAIIAFAMMFRDGRNNGTDYAAMLTPLIAAKSMDGNGCSNSNFDMLEIKQKLEESENRAVSRELQSQISQQGQSFMQIGFGLSNQIKDGEKDTIKEFGEIKQHLGMQGQALQQLLQKNNNDEIIQGVISKLCGMPCAG